MKNLSSGPVFSTFSQQLRLVAFLVLLIGSSCFVGSFATYLTLLITGGLR